MIHVDLSPLANHLWQSTLCAAAVWVLTLAFRKNRAGVRYWLWLTASVKFLVPFSLLVRIGSQFGWRTAPAIPRAQFATVMNEISRPFALSGEVLPLAAASRASSELPMILLGVWLCGVLLGLIFLVRLLRQIRAVERTATPLGFNLPIPVMSSSARFEPGVFGIRKPILVLPAGITDRLTRAQLEAVLVHELCHVRRRDNLTAAIHMVVEMIFWFHPLVWWIRMQLVAERERACDEEVLRLGTDPQVYAEGILNTCRYYLEAPFVCMSGVTGSDLKKRIARIVSGCAVDRLAFKKKLLLAAAAGAAVAGPIAFGLMNAPASRAQSQTESAPAQTFEIASVKPNKSGERGGWFDYSSGRGFGATNVTLEMLIAEAYSVREFQIFGGSGWLRSDRFDIEAKASSPADQPQNGSDDRRKLDKESRKRMLQALLADRFDLKCHQEMRELPMYALVVSKNGPQLQAVPGALETPNPKEPNVSGAKAPGIRIGWGHMFGRAVTLRSLADALARLVNRSVNDQTGLNGVYDFTLDWTPDEHQGPMTIAPLGGPSIFTAIQEQLGLKLESRKGAVEVVVINHVEQPSAN